jgi:hypothetical protein
MIEKDKLFPILVIQKNGFLFHSSLTTIPVLDIHPYLLP